MASGSSKAIHPYFRQVYLTQTLGISTLSWIERRGDSKPGIKQLGAQSSDPARLAFLSTCAAGRLVTT
jgi:hypothetical protein